MEHVGQLKGKFYPEQTLATATERWNIQIAESPIEWIIVMNHRLLEDSLEDEDDEDEPEN